MNNAKDIAEKILNCETYDIPDIQSVARAYLELGKRNVSLLKENTLLILDSIEPRTDKYVTIVGLKKEITKLKEENEKLKKSREALRTACEFYGNKNNWCRFEECIRHDIINPSDVNEEELKRKKYGHDNYKLEGYASPPQLAVLKKNNIEYKPDITKKEAHDIISELFKQEIKELIK